MIAIKDIIPLIMVIIFLSLILVVGIYFSRNTTTLREYAVGSKQFATATLVATTLATAWGGGGLTRTVQMVHERGIYYIPILFSSSISLLIISYIAYRMAPFMQHLSKQETIGSIYGKLPRVITAISFICASVPSIATQITVTSLAIGMCTPNMEQNKLLTIVATIILIFYSAFGGIRAITFTDVLQFLTFSISYRC